ncbi:MAG: LemA family protein, partial [Bacteroidales bacterium]|nr:LemA family protein [Bacteroidales bacterium]
MIILLIILGIIALLVVWVISVQRKLVSGDELCQNSMSQIGVQQQSRWDAISTLADLVKSYNEFEYKTLTDVIAQRKEINGNSTAAEADAQEGALTKAFNQIKLVAEQYPALKSNENYGKIMDSVNTYENQVRTSRMV